MKNSYKYLAMFLAVNTCMLSAVSANNMPLPNNSKRVHVSSINEQEIGFNIEEKSKQHIELNQPAKRLDDSLFESKEDMMKHYFQAQKELDVEDIKSLWDSTVSRNPVIKFALKKLSMPAETRKVHSSRLAKTVSTLINGASMIPAFLGADSITTSATSVGGTLANRVIANKNLPKEIPLTDTELIQLARLVEDLQDKIIKNYYEYKANLESYKTVREKLIQHNKHYSSALQSKNHAQIIAFKQLYDNVTREEKTLKQKLKLNRIQLERLAGSGAMNNLNLGKLAQLEKIKSEEVNPLPMQHLVDIKEAQSDFSSIDVQALSDEIRFELKEERQELLADLQVLWSAAVGKSETIRFAIVKLSNPDGDVEKSSTVKKIFSPIASVAPIVGMGLGSPVTAGSAVFGGNLLNSVMSDDNKINEHLTRVTDSDLVLLAQETDSLQEKLIVLYYDYINAMIDLNYMDKIVKQNEAFSLTAKKTNPDICCIAQSLYEESIDNQLKARQTVLNKRIAIEQFVGNDALTVIDKNFIERITYKSQ